MNAIEYGCEGNCDYHEAVHGKNGRSIYDEKFMNKCRHCTFPMSGRMTGKGFPYDVFNPPQAEGGITVEE